MPKDLFSKQSVNYSKYRPTYSPELFEYILSFTPGRDCAWDCATGNGQAASVLAGFFRQVEATDISEAQLANAVQKENIHYHLAPAESTGFANDTFELITVATAYHWLNWHQFFNEATRVAKNGAVVAVWAYANLQCEDKAVESLMHHYYKDITGPYWDKERQWVDDRYQSIPFRFDPLPTKDFAIRARWSKDIFKGYLSTWSAVQNFIRDRGFEPIQLIEKELDTIWPDEVGKEIVFPVFLRIGRVAK